MMEYVCYLKKEKLGVVSSEGLLPAFVKMWILGRLKKKGFSLTGLRIFLLYGNQRIGILENGNPDVQFWNNEKGEGLILTNQSGIIWIHRNKKMDGYHPAKKEEVFTTVRKQMKK